MMTRDASEFCSLFSIEGVFRFRGKLASVRQGHECYPENSQGAKNRYPTR